MILAWIIRERLVQEFDHTLTSKLHAFVSLVSREGDKIEVDYHDDELNELDEKEGLDKEHELDEEDDEPNFFQVLLEDGQLIRASSELRNQRLPANPQKPNSIRFGNTTILDEENEAKPSRYAQLTFTPRFDPHEEIATKKNNEEEDEDLFQVPSSFDSKTVKVIVTVARNREHLEELLASLYMTIAGIDVLMILSIVLFARYAIRKGLQPIEEINAQISEIGPEALSQRIVLDNPPEEVNTILNALNGLLGKVEDALERERRFSSSVAHELRTPVAELRMASETGKIWPEDTDCVKRLFQDNHDIALHMERIVSNLLELTRCDNKTSIISIEEFNIDQLVRECWTRSAEIAERRELSLEDKIDPEQNVVSDKAKLEIILQNIIDNAISYSSTGSVIVMTSMEADGRLALVIENEANNIATQDLDRIFERFWRKDPARSGGNHSGLGMALVKALVDLLDMKIQIALPRSNIFQTKLVFNATTPKPENAVS